MLPRTCHPGVLAARGERLCGALPVSHLHRFLRSVEHAAEAVRIDLAFGRDESGFTTIKGQLECPVQLSCQRCLEPLDMFLKVEIDVLVTHSQRESEWRRQSRETLIVQDDSLSLHELIEDELLLALPMHASHRHGQCRPPVSPSPRSAGTAATPPNPFAALADLDYPTAN